MRTAGDATEALRDLRDGDVDAVFLDINMPGLVRSGAGCGCCDFAQPPAVVFVTAYDDSAVAAFDLGAVDYLLKPIARDRLAESVRRVAATRCVRPGAAPAPRPEQDPTIPVELGGVTHLVPRARSAGWRRRATTPGCTRSRRRTWCGSRWARSKHAGPMPVSSGCTVRTWCRCRW